MSIDVNVLLQQFIKLRSELPIDHERRVRLNAVDLMRLDKNDNTICHLLTSTNASDSHIRRIKTGMSLEDMARDMLLYPKHEIFELGIDNNYIPIIKDLKHSNIVDIFLYR